MVGIRETEPEKHAHVLSVLGYLAARPGQCVPAMELPDERGRTIGGRGARDGLMWRMVADGLVEYSQTDRHAPYGYRITDAGLAALENSRRNRADANIKDPTDVR